MYYDFVPMPERKPLKWPAGKRLAIIVTFNLEYWDFVKDTEDAYYAGGPAILPDPPTHTQRPWYVIDRPQSEPKFGFDCCRSSWLI